jgi:hypothetical protein
MGSGKVIKRAIEKHGIDNFTKDVLEFFDSDEDMYAREKEVVTEEFLSRSDVYNLRRGGTGGFDYINKHGLGTAPKSTNSVYKHKLSEWGRRGALVKNNKYRDFRNIGNKSFLGRSHSDESKRLIGSSNSKLQSGTKNSQYGSMWITDGVQNKKIPKDTALPLGFRKGRTT